MLKSNLIKLIVLISGLIISQANCVLAKVATSTSIDSSKLIPDNQKPELNIPLAAVNPNDTRLTLKNKNVFLVMDTTGRIPSRNNNGYGLYANDTRYLDAWDWFFESQPIVNLKDDTAVGYYAEFTASNSKTENLPQQAVLLERQVIIYNGLKEKLTITNLHSDNIDTKIELYFGSDFADMFEVRGSVRQKRGQVYLPVISEKNHKVTLAYESLDKKIVNTQILFNSILPDVIEKHKAVFKISLKPHEVKEIEVTVIPSAVSKQSQLNLARYNFTDTLKLAHHNYQIWLKNWPKISTSNEKFNRIIDQNIKDIFILQEPTPKGLGIAAGIPWFNACFGRDEAILALETLVLNHELSKKVILLLSHYQGTKFNEKTQECPGKIMHELRLGEMTRLGEVPFGPYYGTIDATPLYLILISRYFNNTNDLALINEIYPNIESALKYLAWEVDQSTVGPYLSYGRTKDAHLSNQGWKDSFDSVMYKNGRLAAPPISLAEVQGYLYEAYVGQAKLALVMHKYNLNKKLLALASNLKKHFNVDFAFKDNSFVALALDGKGNQCEVIASNPGQLLMTNILSPKLAKAVISKLQDTDLFNGWGIRTLAKSEKNYNPMSYHDGSVWPHDNALIVSGLCNYNDKIAAVKIFTGMYNACLTEPKLRLPELFCGFDYKLNDAPVKYPVSCSPQAWAAGSLFLMLTSCLGLNPDANNHCLRINNPMLPAFLDAVELDNLQIGKNVINLKFIRNPVGYAKTIVISNPGKVRIVIDNSNMLVKKISRKERKIL